MIKRILKQWPWVAQGGLFFVPVIGKPLFVGMLLLRYLKSRKQRKENQASELQDQSQDSGASFFCEIMVEFIERGGVA